MASGSTAASENGLKRGKRIGFVRCGVKKNCEKEHLVPSENEGLLQGVIDRMLSFERFDFCALRVG